ncbi:ubiquinone biosynthesis hydrox [Russula earlei]|uniref:Ubiquinone biosynthesis hydrox n=1 Tax=Russula earlei TaxID=71964 RepID=A0ACC0UF85_9AGAM|nr:ubiquinone biosynthesis hydrox [Russula earlei]
MLPRPSSNIRRSLLCKLSRRGSPHVSGRLISGSSGKMPEYDDCDVVILGGGPVGLALASALSSNDTLRNSLKVTLLESSDLNRIRDWDPPPDAFSNRVVSLTNASLDFLIEMGAWSHVDVERTCPMVDMQVWDGVSDVRIDFNAATLGISARDGSNQMARIIETLNLQRGLLRHLKKYTNVTLLDNTKVENIFGDDILSGGWPVVQPSVGRALRARLVVGADGIKSVVRSYSKIDSYGWDYPARAIVATLQHPPRTVLFNTTAYQRFLPTGPIAFLPLSPTASSLVWSTSQALAAVLAKADPAILASMINAAFRLPELSVRYLHERLLEAPSISLDDLRAEIAFREKAHAIPPHSALASVDVQPNDTIVGIPDQGAEMLPPLVASIQPGTVASFPLRFRHAESYVGSRTVLIGDAAHVMHPLAGQGLNLGLGDAEALARCVQSVIMYGGDIGSRTALMPYSRERYFENHKIMSAVDKLHKLYATTAPPVVWARSTGVEVLNELDALKAGIISAAGGQSRAVGGESFPWSTVANGLEALVSGARVAGAVGSGLKSVAGNILQQLVRVTSDPGNNKRE